MTTTAAVFWTCLGCLTLGETDRTAEKHTKATKHMTLTGIDPAALARIRARLLEEDGSADG
jgi:hypothetical protein